MRERDRGGQCGLRQQTPQAHLDVRQIGAGGAAKRVSMDWRAVAGLACFSTDDDVVGAAGGRPQSSQCRRPDALAVAQAKQEQRNVMRHGRWLSGFGPPSMRLLDRGRWGVTGMLDDAGFASACRVSVRRPRAVARRSWRSLQSGFWLVPPRRVKIPDRRAARPGTAAG